MNIEQVKSILANPENFPISEIFNLLTLASERYYNAVDETEILMTDAEFDSLERFSRSQDPTNSYFIGVGSTVRTGKTNLPYSMGGLDQSFEGDTVKFVDSNGLRDKAFTIAQKMDGTSAMIIYDAEGNLQIGFSRGDSQSGADITRHISKMKNVPKKIKTATPLVIRAEVEVKEEWFKANQHLLLKSDGTPYANARNYVAGKMNASESPQIFYDNVDVIAYTIISPAFDYKDYELKFLKSIGFTVPEYVVMDGRDMNDDVLSGILEDWHKTSPWALDGVVYTVNDRNVQQELTESKKESSSFRPAFARKFKVGQDSNIGTATVVGIEWDVSMHGLLKPVVLISPLELMGVTIRRATGYNAKFIVDSGIGIGAKVTVIRAGDVIPKLIAVPEPVEATLPPTTFGTYHWNETGIDLELDDVSACPEVAIKQLISFFKNFGVEFLSEKSLETLYNAGFTTIESIINSTPSIVEKTIGSKIGAKGMESLAAKLNPTPLWLLAGSGPWFGMGIGRRKMKLIYEAHGKVLGLTVAEIVAVDGFEQKTAERIVAGYPTFQAFLNAIVGKYTEEAVVKAGNSLEGKTFVFTGFRDKEAEAIIESHGGKIGSSVSKTTAYLVTKEKNSTSSKAIKAQSLGVTVIGSMELNDLLDGLK